MSDPREIIREIFGDKIPIECPACGSNIRSVEQNKKVWYDKKDDSIRAGESTATIHYWCDSSFTIGNGCKE